MPRDKKILLSEIQKALSNPEFVSQLKNSLGGPLFSSKLGDSALRSIRLLMSQTFKVSPEHVGVYDEEGRVLVEVGPISASFEKITEVVVDAPNLEEEQMCIGCGETFKVSICENKVFCIECEKGKE